MSGQEPQQQSRDPKVLIEQAIARTGSVDKAALELAKDGISWQRVRDIYDAMLNPGKP
jgi:hypothetical protein